MRKIYSMSLGIVIVILLIAGSFVWYNRSTEILFHCIYQGKGVDCGNAKYDNAEYCFNDLYGRWSYNKEYNKICACDGVIIYQSCPRGVACEGFTARCFGNIVGAKYIFRIGSGSYYQEFDTINQYEGYCNTLSDVNIKEICFRQLGAIKK